MVRVDRGWLPRVVVAAVLTVVVAGALPARAQGAPAGDLPAGFTDGIPVGGPDGPEGSPAPEATTSSAASTRAAPTQRYFGADPWHAIQASSAATARSCTMSDDGLTALVVAPVFKESSAATSAANAPSPMTLSRYDEWTGVMATDTNANANYGLYAFRDPNTAYPRAYWHPGIGIWQYDTAGVGAPFTAIERMDVGTVSADVAKGMASRYCTPSASLIGHAAPFTDAERRNAAWAPWGYPCTACEQVFQEMTASAQPFADITLVPGISVTGGAKARSCTVAGSTDVIPCWYIDPSVGTIEGATGWATVNPGGGSPTVAPAPLSKPFYVLERNGREERHWLAVDTGYDIDISASREIGKNDRPRSNQAGSGLTWVASSGLCDVSTGRGACVPRSPAGVTTTQFDVTGTYRPISLDVDGDHRGDVLWYAPGPATDPLWRGQGSGGFASSTVSISGTYDTVRPLDVDGDGRDDLLWYDSATGASYLWHGKGDGTFTSIHLTTAKGLVPLVLDRDGDGDDEIFWYGRGALADSVWTWNGTAFTKAAQKVAGTYQPYVGDFDGNGRDDIFWYGPGSAPDALWLHRGAGGVASVPVKVGGTYLPLVGDLDGDGRDDIFWYAPGSAADSIWFGAPGGAFAHVSTTVSTSYQPFVADLEGDGRDDIVWYRPGTDSDRWWRWSAGRALTGAALDAPGPHQPVVGAFSAGGTDGVLWYAAGPTPDAVWWH
ncbi:FG-GAP repeat domain-containing protein [Aquihabitans sp. McL0605]|uniref:FG-GAP repeat domain-containing protein n=1 Tax=Aquihabitans sp. McL0605 TaxID=3415671 RepID=UPI003CEBAF35